MEAIGKRIAALIRDKGLTNSQFAQEIDLNPSIVSHILSGRNKVSLQVVLQIKQAFPETDLQYLLTGEPAQSNTSGNFTNVNKENTPSEVQTSTSISEKKPLEANPTPPSPSPSSPKQIERVLILYTDKSVESYVP
jgi:transcriptional regulator with XRE-family HTH domain